MARTPYTNFHDLNLNWIVEKIKTVFTPDNPPPYPVTSVNQKTGAVDLKGTDIPVSANDPQTIANALASKYEKPASGIPASDLAPGVIPDLTSIIDDNAGAQVYDKTWSAHKLFQQEADILDLQNDKQDAPASAGTAGQVLGLNSDLEPEWVDMPEAQMIDAVDDWLSENITNPSNPPLDRSLSLSNACAPADLVGDLKENVDELNNAVKDDLSKYIGVGALLKNNVYIETQNGNETPYNGWSATDFIPCQDEKKLLINTSVATAYNIFYDNSKVKISGFTLAVGDNTVSIPDNAYYYRISNTTEAMETMSIKSALYTDLKDESERSTAYDSMGNALLSGCGIGKVRAFYIPYGFVSGKKYHVSLKNSTASISEIRIVSAENLNQDSIIVAYPIGGDYTAEIDYSCSVNNALYVAVIAVSGTTGFTADYVIFSDYSPFDYINRTKDLINGMIGHYPSYYDVYMVTKQNTIKGLSPLHGIQFAFITDLHFPYNAGHSLELLQAVRKNTAVNLIICGGDFTRAYGGQNDIDMARDYAVKYAKTLYPDWLCLRGNHDFTIRTSAQDPSGITETDDYTYGAIIAPIADWRYEVPVPLVNFYNETYHIGANYCWTLTNEQQKIKIIGFCDMPSTNTERSYGIANPITNAYARYFAQLLEETAGYNVIVATHAPITDQLNGGYNNSLTTIIEAFASKGVASFGSYSVDFENAGTLVCCISGHNHTDQSIKVNGVLHINTTCDASYNDDGYGRTVGTVTEQAFDVFTINTETNHIYTTRIGAGTDRSFTY